MGAQIRAEGTELWVTHGALYPIWPAHSHVRRPHVLAYNSRHLQLTHQNWHIASVTVELCIFKTVCTFFVSCKVLLIEMSHFVSKSKIRLDDQVWAWAWEYILWLSTKLKPNRSLHFFCAPSLAPQRKLESKKKSGGDTLRMCTRSG